MFDPGQPRDEGGRWTPEESAAIFRAGEEREGDRSSTGYRRQRAMERKLLAEREKKRRAANRASWAETSRSPSAGIFGAQGPPGMEWRGGAWRAPIRK